MQRLQCDICVFMNRNSLRSAMCSENRLSMHILYISGLTPYQGTSTYTVTYKIACRQIWRKNLNNNWFLFSLSYTTNTSSLFTTLDFSSSPQLKLFVLLSVLPLSMLCLIYSSNVYHHSVFRIQCLKNPKSNFKNFGLKIPILSQIDPSWNHYILFL